jgi:excisionase family DNA binding protein
MGIPLPEHLALLGRGLQVLISCLGTISFISFIWYLIVSIAVQRGDVMDAVAERAPVFPPVDKEQLSQLHQLRVALQHNGAPRDSAKLVSSDGEELDIPESVYSLLVRIVSEMDQGNGVTVLPVHAELTTQQAAGLLNVSRPYLVRLLQDGEIPFHTVGRHRRIFVKDLLEYKERRDARRRHLLEKMTREAQEAGLYDE